MDERVADVLAELDLADCTGTTFRPAYLAPDAPRLAAREPAKLVLSSGRRLVEFPATHSIGMLARGVLGQLPSVVHPYFHDTDLLDRRRSLALQVGLRVLAVRRTPMELTRETRLIPEEPSPWS
jgi:hypothetical protein